MTAAWRLLVLVLVHRAAVALALASMIGLAVATGLYPLLVDLVMTRLVSGGHATGAVVAPLVAKTKFVFDAMGVDLPLADVSRAIDAHLALVFGAVVLVKTLSQAVRFYAMGWIAQRTVRDLRSTLFAAIVRQGQALVGRENTGPLVARLVSDIDHVERAATYAAPMLVGDALRVLVLASMCILQYPRLSLVSFVVLPLAIVPIAYFGKRLQRFARTSGETIGALTHRIVETLAGMAVVQTYGGEARELERFDRASEDYVRTMMKSVVVRALQTPVMELVGMLGLFATIAYATSDAGATSVRPGEVLAFLLAMVLLYEPIKALGRVSGIVIPGLAAAERMFEIIDRPADVRDRAGARSLEGVRDALRFENVGFRYREDSPFVVSDIDLDLPKGRMIALVGPSGSGKSTLVALIPRLFDPTVGRITIDGIDIRDLEVASLRAHVAIVGQDTHLFDDSIRANIAYGRAGATDAEIRRAAEQAFAHEFIMALPNGYETRTGERGAQISGGQRQRIAIARAFLRNAPILVLDEATSALDSESEREVQRAIDALLEGRTALVVAHRLSTIRRAHEIVVLERGRVVERGTHDTLMSIDGLYARLARIGEGG